jgi:hypothetical protein
MPPPAAAAAEIARFTAGVSMVLPSAVAPNDLTSNGARRSASRADERWTGPVEAPGATRPKAANLRSSLRRMSTRCSAHSVHKSTTSARGRDSTSDQFYRGRDTRQTRLWPRSRTVARPGRKRRTPPTIRTRNVGKRPILAEPCLNFQ